MKSYTDLQQSKKLAEILPIESANMYYISGDEYDICFGSGVYEEIADWLSDGISRPADIPCWSLSALLGVLPSHIYDKTGRKELGIDKSDTYYNIFYENKNSYIQKRANNPVDACVAMIEKLHELNLL